MQSSRMQSKINLMNIFFATADYRLVRFVRVLFVYSFFLIMAQLLEINEMMVMMMLLMMIMMMMMVVVSS